MTFEDARKLHNGDEVILEATGEVIKVLSTDDMPFGHGRPGAGMVMITGRGSESGHVTVCHDEVK